MAPRKMRVALMTGCAQKALNTDINDATIRLLTRLGCEVVVAEGVGCCGALMHHMGKDDESHAAAAQEHPRLDGRDGRRRAGCDRDQHLGCGTTVKDYGHMFRNDPLAEDAARVSALAMDVSEVLMKLDLPEGDGQGADAWPITRPVRCSMASRSRPIPRTC